MPVLTDGHAATVSSDMLIFQTCTDRVKSELSPEVWIQKGGGSAGHGSSWAGGHAVQAESLHLWEMLLFILVTLIFPP